MNDLCGLVPTSSDGSPGQFYRFITAIAIHGGIIQWVINMTVLLTFGASTERSVNSFRFAFVWIVSGAFGYSLASLFLKENTGIDNNNNNNNNNNTEINI
jgi:membrane associated rhomboid family serine protease